MTSHPIGRTVAILVSAALLASLAVATTTAPVSAKPKCFGKAATIVGTARGEVIKGTKKADVIVARGGHDIIHGRGGNDVICGNGGNDKLVGGTGSDLLLGGTGRDKHFGGPGPDRLLGGPADDSFNGGIGNDLCAQGTGSGPRVACERPPVAVAPPPSGPQPIPLTGILAVAYTDLNGNHVYDTHDVMIAELIDTNGDKVPGKDDTIKMGRYPTKLDPGPSDFADWGVKSHEVAGVSIVESDAVNVGDGSGNSFVWVRTSAVYHDTYSEERSSGDSQVWDRKGTGHDEIHMEPASPSGPAGTVDLSAAGSGDDRLVDVELNY